MVAEKFKRKGRKEGEVVTSILQNQPGSYLQQVWFLFLPVVGWFLQVGFLPHHPHSRIQVEGPQETRLATQGKFEVVLQASAQVWDVAFETVDL